MMFELFSSQDLDPRAINADEAIPIQTAFCPGNVSVCDDGFAVSVWLRPNDTSVGDDGVYYLSSGGQRSESCGFYFRLDSVGDPDSNGLRVGVFAVGVATPDRFWQMRYQASMSQMANVIMTWRPDIGLDVYVDGTCAGAQADGGYQRIADVSASCTDDPFQYLYFGRRNDLDVGYAVVEIGQLTVWDAWKNPNVVFNSENEGKF